MSHPLKNFFEKLYLMSVFHLLYLSFGCTYYIISVSVIQCYLLNDRYYTGQDNGKSIAGFPGVIVISGVLAIYELLPAFLCAFAAIILVSLVTGSPDNEVKIEYDSVKRELSK
ncbi:hypothetical protein SAMN04487860_10895 [Ruminococcus flavefaciens]|uniref:Uncharacterized protein n=1 Tax=Ruminococcus flavefaciens TaxID=1265 RepID=A0A1M7KEV6_RUMFL|nr:hypothetical protein SAMN04487860_10895 [Ruminococcus flavefaciens]